MAIKLFISYAHKDENFKNSLEEHLSPLKRQGIIEVWNDRNINVGEDWENEISNNLLTADFILLLISPSFTASDYCYGVEVKKALERHNSGEAVIIPIIVRPCDWNDLPVGKIQGSPKNAEPINKWTNEDEAWLDVIKSLKRIIDAFSKKKLNQNEIDDSNEISITSEFQEWLNDTGLQLSHRICDIVKLSQIYIVPDLQGDKESSKRLINTYPATDLVNNEDDFIIFADEQLGKTSLLKFLFTNFANKKKFVLYLDFNSEKMQDANIEKVLNKMLNYQYRNLELQEYLINDSVLLIDNFDKCNLNDSSRNEFIKRVKDKNLRIILTCDITYRYISEDLSSLDKFKKHKLMGLGHKKREELIKKWVSLGNEYSIDENDLYRQLDSLKENINIVLKKNIVPPKPIYILMILQMFESQKKLDLDLTSFGYCYQHLINNSLFSINIKSNEIDRYLNILTELSWWIFQNERNPNLQELEDFFELYSKSFICNNHKKIINDLKNCGILKEDNFKLGFKYPYIYYFFVARKIAEGFIDDNEIFSQLNVLIDKVYREDYANILIFVTHHSKSNVILEKVKESLNRQFKNSDEGQLCESTLENDEIKFITKFIQTIPKMVIEQRNTQKEREKLNDKLDSKEDISPEYNSESNEEITHDFLTDINRVMKSMDIGGQIIKNRHSSIRMDKLSELTSSSINAGLRFLNYFIRISEKSEQSIIRLIVEQLEEEPQLTNIQIRDFAEKTYLMLTYQTLNMTIQKIAQSIGSKESIQLYEDLVKDHDTPAYHLIKLAIDLRFYKNIDFHNIERLKRKFSNNVVCTRLMTEFVINHLYMYPVKFDDKQKLASILGINIEQQRVLEAEKSNKSLVLKIKH